MFDVSDTSQSANRSKEIFNALIALVPQDIVKEQIRSSIVQDNKETKNFVPFPKGTNDKEIARLNIDSSVPEEAKTKMIEEFNRIFVDKTYAELEVEHPTTEEEISETVKSLAEDLVRAWSIVLMNAIHKAGKNESVCLDDVFLPAMSPSIFFTDPDETFMDYITRMVYQDIGAEQAKVIYLAFKEKVKEAIDQRPDGLEFSIDLFIKKNANGYFVASKT